MPNSGKSNQGSKTQKSNSGSVYKGNGNYQRSDSNGRTTTTNSTSSPGHKR